MPLPLSGLNPAPSELADAPGWDDPGGPASKKRSRYRSSAGKVLAGLCAVLAPAPGGAVEDTTPFLPGISIGVPVGSLPPTGLYFSMGYSVFSTELRDSRGRPTGVGITDLNPVPQVQWITAEKVLGATFGAFVAQPLRRTEQTDGSMSSDRFGLMNTVISPLNLSWALGEGLFVSLGLTFYPGFSQRAAATSVARGYGTIEPGLGLSYLTNDWNVTLHPVLDFNGRNARTGYQSGAIFLMDYNATRRLGRFEFGLGGTLIAQLENDRQDGVTVPTRPGMNGRGNRASAFSLGPFIGYDFGLVALKAYALHDVYADNFPGGTRVWLRLEVPLTGNTGSLERVGTTSTSSR